MQGGLENSKISGVGTNFGLLVHLLPGPNKQREAKPSTFLAELGEETISSVASFILGIHIPNFIFL
jgi:hypothetical protein